MGFQQILLLILGVVLTGVGISGKASKSRKGKGWTDLLGETGSRLLYTVMGIVLIALAFIL